MRGKIIAVFSAIVIIVGALAYAMTQATLTSGASSEDSSRALASGAAKLQLEGLVLERWIAAQARDPKLREVYDAGTPAARAAAATAVANRLRDLAVASPELAGVQPALVVFVDDDGVVVGRNGSASLLKGDNLGTIYPPLGAALAADSPGSDVWVNRKRAEQLLASFAPIHDASGKVLGGLVVGTALNNERLSDTSARTSGETLVLAVSTDGALDVVARSGGTSDATIAAITASKDSALKPLTTGQVTQLADLPSGLVASSRGLEGYGDGRRAVLIAVSEASALGAGLLWPMIGCIAFGLVLVIASGFFLGNYISRPIAEIEEGLLAVMNGRTDLRFEIEHAEFGGLVFRLNSLLNQLLGVQEDDTDDEGRPSHAPNASDFKEALAVDERAASASVGDDLALRDESLDHYRERIFEEYIAAKRQLGDPTEHITRDAFLARIIAGERELSDKHGKPVRYKVEIRDREVVLLAVPLG